MTIQPDDGPHPRPLRIALLGTRGVPASYGGFETAVEEVGRRLVDRGHSVTVYGRTGGDVGNVYKGMRRVTLPAIKKKSLETLSHTACSTVHAVCRGRPDAAVLFNAANSPFVPILRAANIPVALHMDGLEWRRSKWGPAGRRYYRFAETFGVRNSNALIADSVGIADYYRHQFDAPTELITYGAPLLLDVPSGGIESLGLNPGEFHLVVARFEPENHVYEIIDGYRRSSATKPLVVVGSAPYADEYISAISQLAAADERIRLLGPVYNQSLLDGLYFHAYTYIHGHSVGGTNPSLLRAIGAGTAVISYDVLFNRDVLGGEGWFFTGPEGVASAVVDAELSVGVELLGRSLRDRAAKKYDWDEVASLYEALVWRLANGETEVVRKRVRRNTTEWDK